MTAFFKRRMPGIINAPAPELAAITQSQMNLLRALRKNHSLVCAQYVNEGFDGTTTLPLALQQKVLGVSILMLEAAKSGSNRAKDRSRGKLGHRLISAQPQAH